MLRPPRLGPTLDLLIRDAEHPRALAFQWQAITRDMQKLAEILELESTDGLSETIPALTDSIRSSWSWRVMARRPQRRA
ncbi:MAG: alpha-E domain-containing protein [Steroidobacteraceae bacterium]